MHCARGHPYEFVSRSYHSTEEIPVFASGPKIRGKRRGKALQDSPAKHDIAGTAFAPAHDMLIWAHRVVVETSSNHPRWRREIKRRHATHWSLENRVLSQSGGGISSSSISATYSPEAEAKARFRAKAIFCTGSTKYCRSGGERVAASATTFRADASRSLSTTTIENVKEFAVH